MRLYRRTSSRKKDQLRYGQLQRGQFESLESRQMLNAAPVAHDDQYSVLQDTVLSVNNQVPYPSPASFPGLNETQSISVNYTASQIEYSQPYNLLFVREGSSKIHVIDITTGNEISVQSPRAQFVDLDLTADGKYLYVSDYGGTNIGYGTPSSPSYVHRFDVAAREWVVKQAPLVAYRIEGVDAEHFLLQEIDQHVDMMLNHFGSTPSAPPTELSRIRADYYGDFEYDHRTGRVYHGSTGSSSQEIVVRAIVDNRLVSREETGVYGSAQGGGPGSVLSTDGQYFFYGRLQVAASSVRTNIRTLPEVIHASTAGLAFGDGKYYSAETGASMGLLGYSTTVYGVSDHVGAVWAFDPVAKRLRHYDIPHYPLFGVLVNDTDADQNRLTAELVEGPQHGELTLNANGSFDYAPDAGFSGADRFKYRATDTSDSSNVATVTLIVRPLNSVPAAVDDNYRVEYESPLSVAKPPVNPFTYQALTQVASIAAPYQVSQVEFAQHPGLLFVRESSSQIRIIDVASGLEIDRHSAKEAFTDLDLSPSGRYLYVADFGGEVTGHGTPVRPSWVHRYDTATRQWEVKQAPLIAYRIEAVDDQRFLLLESDQWVELTLNSFGATPAAPISELNRGYFSLYSGDIEYDHRTKFVYHGNTGISSPEIAVLKVDGDTLKLDHRTNTYGSAQSGSLPLSLSADGKRLFYGRLQVSSTDVRQNQFLHPRAIFASTAGIAFSNDNIYSAETGEAMATLGYPATLVTASEEGIHLITHDGMIGRSIRIYQAAPLGWGVLANDTDTERDPLTASLVSGPAHGSLFFNSDGSFLYSPNKGYYGNDSFTYRASDGVGNSNTATVNLTVASRAPTATGESYTVTEDGTLDVAAAKGLLINDSDPEAQALSAELVEGPRNGTLTLNEDGSFQYVPRANFFGSDSFTYQASDGVSKSAATIVNLTVTGTPDAPVGVVDSYTLVEDGKLSATVRLLDNDVDPDGDPLTAILVTEPTNGTLRSDGILQFKTDGWFGYLPAANFNGIDQFTYRVSDGKSESAPITVTLNVTPVNDAPVINHDSYVTDEDSPLTIVAAAGVLANDSDIDGDKLFAIITAVPVHGTIHFAADGSFVYTPRADFNGTDTFRYRASDGVASTEASVKIGVLPQPDPPRTVPDSYSVPEDKTLTVTRANGVLSNDTDPDLNILTAKLVIGPSHGELTLNNDGDFIYRPNVDYFGTDSFTYNAYDGSLSAEAAKVTITITPVNDAPVATDDVYRFGSRLTVPAAEGLLRNDRDIDSVQLTASVVEGPEHGKLTLNSDGSFTYIPGPSFLVADSFTYRASDGTAQSNIATVDIEAKLSVITENVTVIAREDDAIEGFFDVILGVPPGDDLSAAGYEVSLAVPAGSGIEFISASSAPESPLFAGQTPVATVVANRLLVTDLSQNGSVTVQDGARLFRVHFQATPTAVGSIPLAFDSSFTSLSDANGRSLLLENLRPGVITVVDGIAPKVSELSVGGASWTTPFRDYLAELDLGTGGFAIAHGTSQPPVLPWTNLDRISVRFSEDVQVDPSDLRLAGINRESYSFAAMSYDAATFTATWVLAAPLVADTLSVTLVGSGEDAVRDRAGNVLDGNPSPDVVGDFQTRFSALPGDVDRSGFTNVLDTVQARNLQFTRAGDSRYSIFHDVDGSGSVSVFDTLQVRSRQFMDLPEAEAEIDPTTPVARIRTENVTVAAPTGEAVEVVFDVYVETIAGDAVSVGAYDAALQMPAGSGFTFVSASTPSAAHPVLFNSRPTQIASQDLFGVTDIFPTGAAALEDNDGLFIVRVLVAPNTLGTFPVTFNAAYTHLVDADGNALGIEFLPGAITVVPGLPAVADLAAEAPAANRVRLTWTDTVDDELGFRVERLEEVGFLEVAVVGANVTHFQDTNLQSSHDYVYRVRAFNALGNGNASGSVEVTMPQLTTITGTSGDDRFHIVRTGDLLQVYQNAPPIGRPTYSSALAAMTGVLTIDAGDGNDALTVTTGEQPDVGLDRLIFHAGTGDNSLVLENGAAEIESTAADGTLDTSVRSEAHLITPRLSQNGLMLEDNSKVSLLPDGATSVITSLAIGVDATLDLNNNALVLDYTGDSPVATIREKIIPGRTRPNLGDGVWTGKGITSSAAAAANLMQSESRAVGYAENALLPLGSYTTYRGVPVDDTSLLITYTRTGDANLDGWVNDEDATILGATYAPSAPNAHWAQADFDYNGVIDDDDVTVMGVFYDPESGGFDQAAAPPETIADDALLDLLAEALVSDHGRQLMKSADRVWIRADAAFESHKDWQPVSRRKVIL